MRLFKKLFEKMSYFLQTTPKLLSLIIHFPNFDFNYFNAKTINCPTMKYKTYIDVFDMFPLQKIQQKPLVVISARSIHSGGCRRMIFSTSV